MRNLYSLPTEKLAKVVLDFGSFTLVGSPADGVAELREHFSVRELVADGERAAEIRGRTVGSAMMTEKARIVIGADRMRSLVARTVQEATYHVGPAVTCAYYSYKSEVSIQDAELYPRSDRMIIAAPTNDGQAITIVYWPNTAFHEVRSDIEGNF